MEPIPAMDASRTSPDFIKRYVSRDHRDAIGDGCTLAALCGDAARQSDAVRAEFAAGIESLLATLAADTVGSGAADQRKLRTELIDMLAHSVGAVMLSRACPDGSALAEEILRICRKRILATLAARD